MLSRLCEAHLGVLPLSGKLPGEFEVEESRIKPDKLGFSFKPKPSMY